MGFCSNCGNENYDDARFCNNCGACLAPGEGGQECRPAEKRGQSEGKVLAILGIIFACCSLLVLPIVFGPLAVVFGVIAALKGELVPGIVAIVLGVLLAVLSYLLSALILLGML